MKNLHTFEEFVNESVVNEADMSRQYDGFIVYDSKNKKSYKFRYERGNNVPQENEAIKALMDFTKLPRGSFMVHGFVRKGEWDKDPTPEMEN
jgi:hypothetical protein